MDTQEHIYVPIKLLQVLVTVAEHYAEAAFEDDDDLKLKPSALSAAQVADRYIDIHQLMKEVTKPIISTGKN
jgi:hypothetical protein